MSDGNRIRSKGSDQSTATTGRTQTPATVRLPVPADRAPGVPSAAGTAVLHLSDEQTTGIRSLLVGLRSGQKTADDVRKTIFGLLSGSQRRMLDAAYFIISVRV